MHKMVPVYSSDQSVIERFSEFADESIAFEYMPLSHFDDSYDRSSDTTGVIVIFLLPDNHDFAEHIFTLKKKFKKKKIMIVLVMDNVDPKAHETIFQNLKSTEFIFYINANFPMALCQEVFDLVCFRQYLVESQIKYDEMKAMAYQAMESASEIGLITLLLEKSGSVVDKDHMMSQVLETMSSFNLSGSILFVSEMFCEAFYCSDDGQYREREQRIMNAFRAHLVEFPLDGRFKVFGNRLLVSGKHITLLVRQLPKSEEERGRIRDTLGALINAADAMAQNVEVASAKKRRENIVSRAVASVSGTVKDVKSMFKAHEKKTMMTMDELIRRTEEGLLILGLTEEQENYLLENLERAMANLVAMYSDSIAIESKFDNILESMTNIQQIS